MAASVCLRILLDLSDGKLAKLDALGPLVSKVTGAFLETCWAWPDRYTMLTPFSFMLIEPGATEVSVDRVARLAHELKVKLFGQSDAGDVLLLLLDGSELDTARFVALDHASLKRVAQNLDDPAPFGGQIMRISSLDEPGASFCWRRMELDPKIEAPAAIVAVTAEQSDMAFHGVYDGELHRFVGNMIVPTPASAPKAYSLVDGIDQVPTDDAAMTFDFASLEAVSAGLARPDSGLVLVPVCFSSLMRRSTRQRYADAFTALPADQRERLGVSIYDTPRSLVFNAVTQLHQALGRFFAHVDVHVVDPDFEPDQIPTGSVHSVTLRLPDLDERARLAAMRRFIERRDHFERRQIRLGLTNVRARTEVHAGVRLGATWLTGRGVCGSMSEPVSASPMPVPALPLKWAGRASNQPAIAPDPIQSDTVLL